MNEEYIHLKGLVNQSSDDLLLCLNTHILPPIPLNIINGDLLNDPVT